MPPNPLSNKVSFVPTSLHYPHSKQVRAHNRPTNVQSTSIVSRLLHSLDPSISFAKQFDAARVRRSNMKGFINTLH